MTEPDELLDKLADVVREFNKYEQASPGSVTLTDSASATTADTADTGFAHSSSVFSPLLSPSYLSQKLSKLINDACEVLDRGDTQRAATIFDSLMKLKLPPALSGHVSIPMEAIRDLYHRSSGSGIIPALEGQSTPPKPQLSTSEQTTRSSTSDDSPMEISLPKPESKKPLPSLSIYSVDVASSCPSFTVFRGDSTGHKRLEQNATPPPPPPSPITSDDTSPTKSSPLKISATASKATSSDESGSGQMFSLSEVSPGWYSDALSKSLKELEKSNLVSFASESMEDAKCGNWMKAIALVKECYKKQNFAQIVQFVRSLISIAPKCEKTSQKMSFVRRHCMKLFLFASLEMHDSASILVASTELLKLSPTNQESLVQFIRAANEHGGGACLQEEIRNMNEYLTRHQASAIVSRILLSILSCSFDEAFTMLLTYQQDKFRDILTALLVSVIFRCLSQHLPSIVVPLGSIMDLAIAMFCHSCGIGEIAPFMLSSASSVDIDASQAPNWLLRSKTFVMDYCNILLFSQYRNSYRYAAVLLVAAAEATLLRALEIQYQLRAGSGKEEKEKETKLTQTPPQQMVSRLDEPAEAYRLLSLMRSTHIRLALFVNSLDEFVARSPIIQ